MNELEKKKIQAYEILKEIGALTQKAREKQAELAQIEQEIENLID